MTSVRAIFKKSLLIAVCLFGLIAMSACSRTVAPNETIGAAQMAIEEAERLEAGTYAQADLDMARSKLRAADEKSNGGEYVEARRFAEQAAVDANLARARAQHAKSEHLFKRARIQVAE